MSGVSLRKVEKTYPNGFKAVHGIDLDIEDGEFMVFVGPSGCAKSTTLRMIAGLEGITGGEIIIGDKCVNQLLPKDRGISMVFQNYALYPHMSAYQNMSFGLRNAGYDKQEVHDRVMDAARKLEIESILERKPKELSGGQCQRVAVGRAIVRKPDVFLFDEPLSNLDAKLRVSMRAELIQLHRQLREDGVSSTMIYVTHDQVEAMTMGDRICVMNSGEIMQVDTPINLYHAPQNRFVAEFIGSPSMNIPLLRYEKGRVKLNDVMGLQLPTDHFPFLEDYKQDEIWFGVRPEHTKVLTSKTESSIPAKISNVERMGNEDLIYCQVGDLSFVSRMASNIGWIPKVGDPVHLEFDLSHLHLFDGKTEKALTGHRMNPVQHSASL